MKIQFSPPDISEKEIGYVTDVLKSNWITTGAKVKQFEREIADYCGTKRAVCLNSATASLELTLRLFGIGEGDEVITSVYTYSATASVVHHVGARIVLIDTQKDSVEMDYDAMEAAISERTKVIIPVDIAGKMCDYDKIRDIVNRNRDKFQPRTSLQSRLGHILILSDAAHSFGAMRDGTMSGSAGDFSCFSFHAVKNLTTAEGGAVTWRDIDGVDNDWIYRQYMLNSIHGQTKDALAKIQYGSWEYDILEPLYKCNMTDISAALGLAQLERYAGLLQRRREIIERYDEAFAGTRICGLRHYSEGNYSCGHLYMTRVSGIDEMERNRIIKALAEEGIATNVHYKPLPMLTAYKNLGFKVANYPNAYELFRNEISIPLHTLLTDEEIAYIIKTYKDIVERK